MSLSVTSSYIATPAQVAGGVWTRLVSGGTFNPFWANQLIWTEGTAATLTVRTNDLRFFSGGSAASTNVATTQTFFEYDIEVVATLNDVTRTDIYMGFSTGSTGGDGAYYYLNGGTNNFSTDQAARTDTTITTYADGTEHTFRLDWNDTPNVVCYLDGNVEATHTTNIPTAAHAWTFAQQNVSGAGQNLDIKSINILDIN